MIKFGFLSTSPQAPHESVPVAVYATSLSALAADDCDVDMADVAAVLPAGIPNHRLVMASRPGHRFDGYPMAVPEAGYVVLADLLVPRPNRTGYERVVECVRRHHVTNDDLGSAECPYVEQRMDLHVPLGTHLRGPALIMPAIVYLPASPLLALVSSAVPVLGDGWSLPLPARRIASGARDLQVPQIDVSTGRWTPGAASHGDGESIA